MLMAKWQLPYPASSALISTRCFQLHSRGRRRHF